jgi:hypothetical protein
VVFLSATQSQTRKHDNQDVKREKERFSCIYYVTPDSSKVHFALSFPPSDFPFLLLPSSSITWSQFTRHWLLPLTTTMKISELPRCGEGKAAGVAAAAAAKKQK